MSSAQTCPKSRVIQKRPFDRPTFLRDCGLQVLSTDSTTDSRNKLLFCGQISFDFIDTACFLFKRDQIKDRSALL